MLINYCIISVGRDLSIHSFLVSGLIYDAVFPNTFHVFMLNIQLVLVGGDESYLGGQQGSDRLHFNIKLFMASLPVHDEESVDLEFELSDAQRNELQVILI